MQSETKSSDVKRFRRSPPRLDLYTPEADHDSIQLSGTTMITTDAVVCTFKISLWRFPPNAGPCSSNRTNKRCVYKF